MVEELLPSIIALVPALPLAGFLLVGLNANRLSKGLASIIACGTILISFVIAVALFVMLIETPVVERYFYVNLFSWISAGNFSAPLAFYIDPLSATMLLII